MDTIADFLVRIKNAIGVRKETVDVPHSKVKEELAKILAAEGFISKYEAFARMNKKFLRLGLKYAPDKKGVIAGMRRVSTPGRRIYVSAGRVPRVQSGFGLAIISTSKGLMTDRKARQNKVGGEVLCYVW